MPINTITTPTIHHRPFIAVHVPEVVSHILSYLAPSETSEPSESNIIYQNTKHLYQCLLVNHLWYECTLRHLWRHVMFQETWSDTWAFYRFASTFANQPISNLIQPLVPAPCSFSTFSSPPSTADPTSPCENKQDPPAPSLSTPLASTPQPSVSSNPPSSLSSDLHHQSLRSLTLHHIKKGSRSTASLRAIAEHATHLQRLDIYIGDYVTDEAVGPMFMHPWLTSVSLAGCARVSDASILALAHHAPDLVHLDLRACDLVSDVSLTAIAKSCRRLRHLNVGRVHQSHRVTDQSMVLIAKYTQVTVLGLAGCNIGDPTILALCRPLLLERVSVNQCHRLTNRAIQALACCPNLTVVEIKGCPKINDWYTIDKLVDRKVSLTLSDEQKHAFQHWSRLQGKSSTIKPPVKK